MKNLPLMLGFYWTPSGDNDEIEHQFDVAVDCGANTVVTPHRTLDRIPWARLRTTGIRLCVDWTIFAGEPLRQRFPDSVPVDANGDAFERDEWYLPACPNQGQIRQHHLQTMEAVMARNGDQIAGIWLDFIRYPVRWERAEPRLRQLCFCPTCLHLFLNEQRTAYSSEETRRMAETILRERRAEWVDWKCDRIAGFVQAVRDLITSSGHGLTLGMFSLPWRRSDRDGALRTIAAQDLRRLGQIVDVISPMVYHKLCYQSLAWITQVAEDAGDWAQRPIVPVVQSMDQPQAMPATELDAALRAAMDATTATGVLIFTLAPLLESPDKMAVVRERFAEAG